MRYLYLGVQKLQEAYFKTLPNCGEILMFHQVDNNKENWIDENVSITYESFKNLINELFKGNKSFGSINEIDTTSKKIYITFDDGFLDTYNNAYPVLKKFNIPFCIFVTTDFINKENYLTYDMLNELALEPLCTIGAHTLSHPLLRFENHINSYNEIYKSKCLLEEYIGKEVEYFAYPYGSIYACSKKDIRNAYKAGYKMAFSTINSHLNNKVIKSRFFIPRINVYEKNYMNIG